MKLGIGSQSPLWKRKKNQIENEVYPNKGDCARKMITANLKQKDMHLIIFVP